MLEHFLLCFIKRNTEWYDGTILLAGAISDGFSVASALAMGADLAYIGTRFIATRESEADDDYKNMLIESAAKDVVYTNYFSGVKGNYLSPSVARAGMDPENLPEADKTKMNFNSGGNASRKYGRIYMVLVKASVQSKTLRQ